MSINKETFFSSFLEIEMNDSRKALLKSLIANPKNDLIIFKIISDPEDFPDDVDCVDLG